MRLERLVARGFRNLHDIELELPNSGMALLGENGQGKTNLLEAIYYPVFFRSFHGAGDREVMGFGGHGFGVEARIAHDGPARTIAIRYAATGRNKQIELDGCAITKLAEGIGHWLAVAFLPRDLTLAAGAAVERRRYLDRMLAIADRSYYESLARYRAALAQRNAALRQNRLDLARAFDPVLAAAGSRVVAGRFAWVAKASAGLAAELDRLGETATADIGYSGNADLADAAAWPRVLAAAETRDRHRGSTGVGPHRDDLRITLDGHSIREFGSTGRQRSVAIALKFLELETLEDARSAPPALLLDDVFAELDRDRQGRLADRLAQAGSRQIFLSSPRSDELPPNLSLPIWRVTGGRVES